MKIVPPIPLTHAGAAWNLHCIVLQTDRKTQIGCCDAEPDIFPFDIKSKKSPFSFPKPQKAECGSFPYRQYNVAEARKILF